MSQRGQVLLAHSDTVSSGPTQQSATHMVTSRIRQKVDFCHGPGCTQNGWEDWQSGLAMDLTGQTRYQPPLLLLSSTEPTVDAGGREGALFSESGHYMPGHVTDRSQPHISPPPALA